MNARDYLERVWTLEDAVKLKRLEEQRLFDIASDATSKMPDGMPFANTGITPKKLEDAAIAHMKAQEATEKALEEYKAYREEVIANMAKLTPLQYGALYRYYILRLTWEKTAESMDKSTRQIHRIKKKALKNFQNILK